MPKKRAPTYDIKPSSSAHPSLSSSKPKEVHSLASHSSTTGNTVNDRIQQLRISQASSPSQDTRAISQALSPGTGASLPPFLRNILRFPDAPPPRPRPGLRVTGRTRGLAGPAPPASWLSRREHGAGQKQICSQIPGEVGATIEALPGSYLPKQRSLLDTTVKSLARDWDWHIQYDQYYLASIPVRYKEALLYYMARYNQHGVDKAGLELLFLDETELEDATGVEGLTHLELATSIGHPLKFGDLKAILKSEKSRSVSEDTANAALEDWDSIDISSLPFGLPKFHALTHLSLAHPNASVTWKGLLDLAPHLTTITHLSLAYWPTPTLSPNAATAYRETPQGNVNFGASNFYSAHDNEWSGAASILRRLGKSTYCLRWLDLTGCYPWIRALAFDQIDWCGAWQAMETIKVGQGWSPQCFQPNSDERVWRDIYFRQGACAGEEASNSQRKQLINWALMEGVIMNAVIPVHRMIDSQVIVNMRLEAQRVDTSTVEQRVSDDWQSSNRRNAGASKRANSKLMFEQGYEAQ